MSEPYKTPRRCWCGWSELPCAEMHPTWNVQDLAQPYRCYIRELMQRASGVVMELDSANVASRREPDAGLKNEEIVERVRAALSLAGSSMSGNQWWQEVTNIPGRVEPAPKGVLVFFADELPEIYVIRGSQMYKLWEWPGLPAVDTSKEAMR